MAAARVYAGIAVSSARKLVPGRDNIGKDEAMRLVMKGLRGVMCHDQADEFDIARAAALSLRDMPVPGTD